MMLTEWKKWLAGAQWSATAAPVPVEDAQRRQMLLSKGVHLQAGFTDRFDHCSLAVLDPDGMVVSWYDASFGPLCGDDAVLYRHVSQFYVPSDIATDVPGRSLRGAVDCGIDTQHGWRRRPGGAIYWGTTVVETIEANDGCALGFAHVTRRTQGPWEAIHVAARGPKRQRRTRVRLSWSVGGMEPSLAAI